MEKFIGKYDEVIPVIGNNHFRQELIRKVKDVGFEIETLVHPTLYVSRTAVIQMEAVVEPKAIVNAHTIIGTGAIVKVGAIIQAYQKLEKLF